MASIGNLGPMENLGLISVVESSALLVTRVSLRNLVSLGYRKSEIGIHELLSTMPPSIEVGSVDNPARDQRLLYGGEFLNLTDSC
jgi:hypothetical protein